MIHYEFDSQSNYSIFMNHFYTLAVFPFSVTTDLRLLQQTPNIVVLVVVRKWFCCLHSNYCVL